jgi:hypothetical protein
VINNNNKCQLILIELYTRPYWSHTLTEQRFRLPLKTSWANPFHCTSSFQILYFFLVSLLADCLFLQPIGVHSRYLQLYNLTPMWDVTEMSKFNYYLRILPPKIKKEQLGSHIQDSKLSLREEAGEGWELQHLRILFISCTKTAPVSKSKHYFWDSILNKHISITIKIFASVKPPVYSCSDIQLVRSQATCIGRHKISLYSIMHILTILVWCQYKSETGYTHL